MEKFNLQEKVDEILNQLRQYGASPKKLKDYRSTGFGNMLRYYKRNGITEVDLHMLELILKICILHIQLKNSQLGNG